jgi:hypothetical protein
VRQVTFFAISLCAFVRVSIAHYCRHVARWELDEDPARGHVSYFLDHALLRFRGKELPSTAGDAKITFMGPGSIVSFRFTVGLVLDVLR